MTTTQNNQASESNSSFEWWYVAHFVFGVIYLGFVPILVPTYVIEISGSAAEAGVVMAIIGLGALLAPVIGGFADKYRAHRIAQLAGLLALALGGVAFAVAREDLFFAIAAILVGVGVATVMMINPTFIVGAGFSQDMESRRLTRLNQTAIVGQLTGGLLVAGLTQAGLSFPARFMVMAAIALIGLVITAMTNKEAAARLASAGSPAEEQGTATPDLKTILVSAFGLFLLSMMINGLGQGALESQYPNYMQKVFSISPALSASALSVTAIFNLLLIGVAGTWMARSGPTPVFFASLILRLAAAVVLIVLAIVGGVPAFLPLGMYVLLLVGIAWVDLVGPALAGRLSVATMGTTQGFLMGSLAIGTALGSLSGGLAAESIGFQSLPWITAGGVVLALLFGYMAISRSRTPEPAKVSA
jgi:predicted MFS family arabinose efflux permease